MEKKSRILIVGATGNLGFELAKASLQASHPTFALVRDSAFSDRLKSRKLQTLSDQGASLLKGSLQEKTRLVEAIKQVDVVICAVSSKQVLDQKLLIEAIKQAGCVKLPTELNIVVGCWEQLGQMESDALNQKIEEQLVEHEQRPHQWWELPCQKILGLRGASSEFKRGKF